MSLADTLAQAEQFIAGFEDDATQQGVRELLQRLRHYSQASQAVLPLGAPKSVSKSSLHDDWVWFRNGETGLSGYFHRSFNTGKPYGYWISEGLRDTLGRYWSRSAAAVIDDFGNLVEVPA